MIKNNDFHKILPFAKFQSKKSEGLFWFKPQACVFKNAELENKLLGSTVMLQLNRRWVRTDQHEGPTDRLSESSCASERTKVEECNRSGGGDPSLVVERLRLLEKKENISVETNSESELRLWFT